MKPTNMKLFGWLLGVACMVGLLPVQGQSPVSGSTGTFTLSLDAGTASSTDNFEFRTDGMLISKGVEGTGTGTLLSGDQGAGTRFLWYPTKAALRVGVVSGTDWNDSNIGLGSVALGQDTTAAGANSVAMGVGSDAASPCSIAMGYYDYAGYCGVAIGFGANASAGWSYALGSYAEATGGGATAIGNSLTASGQFSLATGTVTTAAGDHSATFNLYTTSSSYASVAMGIYNGGVTVSSGTSWISTDPLFELGNGADSGHPSDALVVYKNGNAALQGTMQISPGGDIPMYSGS